MTPSTTTISATVYTTDSCTRCPRMIKQLTRAGITPQVIDVGNHDAARRLLVDDLGLQEVPLTVVTGLFDHPVAFTGQAIDQLIAVRRRLRELDEATRESIDSRIGLGDNGLPTGLDYHQLHWMTISGEITPVVD